MLTKVTIAFSQTKKIIIENSGTTIAGILTTSFSLIILGTFSLIYLNLISMSQVFLSLNHYSLFLEKEITEVERQDIIAKLQSDPGIKNINQLSPDQALESLLSSFEEKDYIIQNIRHNPLPEIIEFQKRRELLPNIRKKLERLPGVNELVYGKETFEQINMFFRIANFVGWLMIVLLSVSIIFITSNSIKIALFSRLPEVEILKVLGATPRFIRWPYILEGIFISLCGFVLGVLGIFILYHFLLAGITFSPASMEFRLAAQFFSLTQLGVILFFVLALGVYGAIIATNKIFKFLAI